VRQICVTKLTQVLDFVYSPVCSISPANEPRRVGFLTSMDRRTDAVFETV